MGIGLARRDGDDSFSDHGDAMQETSARTSSAAPVRGRQPGPIEVAMRIRSKTRRSPRFARAGNALLVSVLLIPALAGIVSLAVDFGRVQLVKSQLQTAADAAARHAAGGIDAGAATDRAISAAADNLVDGAALVLLSEDVETGLWNTQTRTFTPGGMPANAVRVTARRTAARGTAIPLMFGAMIGKPNHDVTVTSVALFNGGTTGSGDGFLGLDRIDFGNNVKVNSYNSALGAPGGANLSATGGLASNDKVKVGNNANIQGTVKLGPSAEFDHGNNLTLTGGEMTQGNAFDPDPTESPTVSSAGALSRGNNQTVTLTAGTYHYSSITFGNNGKLVTTGPVTLYVSGDIVVGNNFRFEAAQNRPSNLKIRLYGAGRKLDTGNNFEVTGELYGPGFEVNAANNAVFRGSVTAKKIKGGNNAEFYRDTSIDGAGGSGAGGAGTVATVN